MIKIYQKTQKEIEKETSLDAWLAREVKGKPKRVCPTYLVMKDGTKIDTADLTEEQIMAIIDEDVQDFLSPTGSYRTHNHLYSFDLIKATERSWIPSADAILQTYAMEQTYGHIMADLRGVINIQSNNVVGKAETIARFQKESNGDFEPPTTNEIVSIIQQMSYNEKAKQQMRKPRF